MKTTPDNAVPAATQPPAPDLIERLRARILSAEHKPGQWMQSRQSIGAIVQATPSPSISQFFEPETHLGAFGYKRDAWLAVEAVNALPTLIEIAIAAQRAMQVGAVPGDLAQALAGLQPQPLKVPE